ncbi:hypothetical protein P3T23_009407 [Paraburkholderia sp. GAS448]
MFPIDSQLGTSSPFWTFSALNSVLTLYEKDGGRKINIRLEAGQANRVCGISPKATIAVIATRIGSRPVQLHLVGKKLTSQSGQGLLQFCRILNQWRIIFPIRRFSLVKSFQG